MTVASTKLSPSVNTKGQDVKVDIFHLDQIPDAMDKMGWKVAPQLMRHWFSITPAFKFTEELKIKLIKGDATEIPEKLVNDTIVKMAWARPYIKEKLLERMKTWNSAEGIKLLVKRLKDAGYSSNMCVPLGMSDSARVLDATAQVNTIKVGGLLDTIDDWYGAIGNASLNFAVNGYSGTHHGRSAFFVDRVGVYIKDTYDFVDDGEYISEPLGVWSKSGVLSKAGSVAYLASYGSALFGILAREWRGFVPIYNSDFRDWQDKHNAGGDFIVFSDVLWLKPLPNQRVIYL
ncbi:DUF6402 family protein [Plesiomonas shigelloides]|uniref:DUF6402 family protein n=1 Tax=Plesiomonas shigelloides TaxID=703 RepID=UPI001261B44A|nr:DUF6402 family protein [Plesiomonas shigelloides]KAB7692335.1 hypothetical protein GBN20_02020 [Plesiomonas shigelloides]